MFKNETFVTPLRKRYWVLGGRACKDLRVLVFSALMIALAIALHSLFIPLGATLRIYFNFIPYFLIALVAGPFVGFFSGFVIDTLSYLLFPTGAYFPGYALSVMLTVLVFALFLFGQRVTWFRLFISRLIINLVINVGLGSLWNHMIYGKAMFYYMGKSLVKNVLMLPVEVLIMGLIFMALRPMLASRNYIVEQNSSKLPII